MDKGFKYFYFGATPKHEDVFEVRVGIHDGDIRHISDPDNQGFVHLTYDNDGEELIKAPYMNLVHRL